ncbi:hypothetical protein MP638_005212 [Amoeboaphelidium occidentale]|nr:hypothetical protein MP638_005212 [Amoeboaphelidium occidentale]
MNASDNSTISTLNFAVFGAALSQKVQPPSGINLDLKVVQPSGALAAEEFDDGATSAEQKSTPVPLGSLLNPQHVEELINVMRQRVPDIELLRLNGVNLGLANCFSFLCVSVLNNPTMAASLLKHLVELMDESTAETVSAIHVEYLKLCLLCGDLEQGLLVLRREKDSFWKDLPELWCALYFYYGALVYLNVGMFNESAKFLQLSKCIAGYDYFRRGHKALLFDIRSKTTLLDLLLCKEIQRASEDSSAAQNVSSIGNRFTVYTKFKSMFLDAAIPQEAVKAYASHYMTVFQEDTNQGLVNFCLKRRLLLLAKRKLSVFVKINAKQLMGLLSSLVSPEYIPALLHSLQTTGLMKLEIRNVSTAASTSMDIDGGNSGSSFIQDETTIIEIITERINPETDVQELLSVGMELQKKLEKFLHSTSYLSHSKKEN